MSAQPQSAKRKSTQTILGFLVAEKRNKAAIDSEDLDEMDADSPVIGLRKVGGASGPKRLIVKDFKGMCARFSCFVPLFFSAASPPK
jgi:hypothetical protein